MKRFSNISAGFLGIVITLLMEHLFDPIVNMFPSTFPSWMMWVLLGMIIFAIAVVIYTAIKPRYVQVSVKTQPLHDQDEVSRNARKGLILLLPLYYPRGAGENPLAMVKDPAARKKKLEKAVQAGEGKPLIEKSNFATAFYAIQQHAGKLEHCWIITSLPGKNSDPYTGANIYADVFVDFVSRELNLPAEVFHTGPECQVSLQDDAYITERVRAILQNIHEKARRKYGFKPDDIIADFTSGFRSMSIGVILESLGRKRDLQFMATKYNANNKPCGELFPLLFDVSVRKDDA